MSKHLQRDLDQMTQKLLAMRDLVEEATRNAISALIGRQSELADRVRAGDSEVDSKEIEVEEDCLKILALHQPVAADLRYIVTVLKVNNDLERIGDLAVNIAKRAKYLAGHPSIGVPDEYSRMAETVGQMVHDSLEAMVQHDVTLAREVCDRDDEVDRINKTMFAKMQDRMRENPDEVKRAVQTLSASRYLERIADLATNVAEDVVFMVEGEIIRHGHKSSDD